MHGFWFAVIRKQIIMAISNGVRLENYCLLNHNNRIRDKIDSYISRKDYMNSDKKNKTWNVVNCKKRFHIKLFNDKNAVNTGVRHRNWFQFFNFMKSILVLLGLRAIDLKKMKNDFQFDDWLIKSIISPVLSYNRNIQFWQNLNNIFLIENL